MAVVLSVELSVAVLPNVASASSSVAIRRVQL